MFKTKVKTPSMPSNVAFHYSLLRFSRFIFIFLPFFVAVLSAGCSTHNQQRVVKQPPQPGYIGFLSKCSNQGVPTELIANQLSLRQFATTMQFSFQAKCTGELSVNLAQLPVGQYRIGTWQDKQKQRVQTLAVPWYFSVMPQAITFIGKIKLSKNSLNLTNNLLLKSDFEKLLHNHTTNSANLTVRNARKLL